MNGNPVTVCPVCEVGEITRHCPGSTVCRWTKCRNRPCSAVLDPVRRHGFVMRGSTAVQVPWPA